MRVTLVLRGDRLVVKGGPLDTRPPTGPESDFPAPMLIRDDMPALRSMGDGRFYDSKSALRASYRAQGLREVGNDVPLTPQDNRKPITKAEIGAAYQKVREGYRPAPLEHGVLPPEAQED